MEETAETQAKAQPACEARSRPKGLLEVFKL